MDIVLNLLDIRLHYQLYEGLRMEKYYTRDEFIDEFVKRYDKKTVCIKFSYFLICKYFDSEIGLPEEFREYKNIKDIIDSIIPKHTGSFRFNGKIVKIDLSNSKNKFVDEAGESRQKWKEESKPFYTRWFNKLDKFLNPGENIPEKSVNLYSNRDKYTTLSFN